MDVKLLCKRSICGLAAVSMMLFAVFVAPFRGSALDAESLINATIDYCYDATSKILDKLSLVPGASIPINYTARPVLDLGYQFFKGDGYADQAKQMWIDYRNQGNFNEVDVNSSYCVSGLYSRNNQVHTISLFTYPTTTMDINHYFSLVTCEDYQVLLELLPASSYGAEDYNITFKNIYGSQFIQYEFRDLNGHELCWRIYVYSNGDYLTSSVHNMGTSYFNFNFYFYSSSGIYAMPDSPSALLSHFDSSNPTANGIYVGSLCSKGAVSTFPHAENYQTFTEDNIYNYYQNDVYPYIVNEYPEITFNSPQYYYEINNPTEPTETGEAAPFTLPPEWLEDRVDLETDHFTVPYSEMVQDPWEYIQGQATTTGAGTTTEPLRGQFRTETAIETVAPEPTLPGVLHADPAIMSAMWDFENFAQELLSRSGLWAIFAGLAAAGICIRLISLH